MIIYGDQLESCLFGCALTLYVGGIIHRLPSDHR